MKKVLLLFLCILALSNLTAWSQGKAVKNSGTIVKDLRVEYLKNPVGIDVAVPRFSWKMESGDRGTFQKAYQITVSTDLNGENVIWNSGKVESDKSIQIRYGGNPLEASKRYYWSVTVESGTGESIKSTETAFFETGLLNHDWSGAKWLKTTTRKLGEEPELVLENYSIELKFTIETGGAGPLLFAKDYNNFFLWQVYVDLQEGRTMFRPHMWRNGAPEILYQIDITDKINVQKRTEYTLRVDVAGSVATTYINNIKIDEMDHPDGEDFNYGPIGFRSAGPEQAYYDDIKVTTIKDGASVTVFSEDFSDPDNNNFASSSIVNGKLYLEQSKFVWQKTKTEADKINKYTIEMDFAIEEVAAGIIFGAKDKNSFFMWQINIETPGKTLFRPHSWNLGSGTCLEEKDITGIINIQAGTTYKLRIDVNGNKASTYINNILIDDQRSNPLGGNYGYGALGVGFRADLGQLGDPRPTEKVYYDNIVVNAVVDGATVNKFFSEDFSNANNFKFTFGSIVNGRLFMEGKSMSNFSWQKIASESNLKYDLELDMTLINHNGGIIFSAKDKEHFYMWAINTQNESAHPILRKHYYPGGNPVYWDVEITAFTKEQLLNHERHIKISIEKNIVKTYIDNVLIDTHTDNENELMLGGIGLRAYLGNGSEEIAYYDNIVLTDRSSGTANVIISEDFENGSTIFDGVEMVIVNGNTKVKMYSELQEKRVFDNTSGDGIPMFRVTFNLTKTIQSAKIYTSALGVYDVFINGKRVGTPAGNGKYIYDELKPGWTDYSKTVFYSTYDVTELLQQGGNAMGAQVSSGWWTGAIAHNKYKTPIPGFIAKLLVEYTNGTSETFVTDPETWTTSSNGALRAGDIYAGENYDARKESAWTTSSFDASDWFQTTLNKDFEGQIKAFTGPAVQVRPELERTPVKIVKYEGTTNTGTTYGNVNVKETYTAPAAVSLTKGQTAVYDLGQNMAGWVKFKVKGAAGTKMIIRFGEMLNDNGDIARGNDGPGGSLYTANLLGAKATLYYTLKGDAAGEIFSPSTTYFGFRYCSIGTTGNVEIQSLTGDVIGAAVEEGSSFTTSNSAVNQLYQNILWGQRGNFLSVPTNCPQRNERFGSTGDFQLFGYSAAYNADLAAYFQKWMGDLRDSQHEYGPYSDYTPHIDGEWGNAGWAEAGLLTPWLTYLMYGDISMIEDNFDSMELHMDFLENEAGGGYQYNGGGITHGDWGAPTEETVPEYVSACYYAYAAQLMEKMSKAMSKAANDTYDKKARNYKNLFDGIKSEFQERFVNTDGSLKENTQTAYLLALKLGLFANESAKTKAIADLNQKIANNGNKLSTGYVGTGIINQTLSEAGSINTAYNLLLQRNNPSWLYSVDQGATTVWERWNAYSTETGFNSNVATNSFNHYANGAVAEWMYRYVAGINADEQNPGFKHVVISPSPDYRKTIPSGQERITSAAAVYNSSYGAIESSWKMVEDDNVVYNITIPANTSATVSFYTKSDEVVEGTTPAAQAEGVTSFELKDGKVTMTLNSGAYTFKARQGEPPSGIKDVKSNNKVVVYPNPAAHTLYVDLSEDIQKIQLLNINGIVVYNQESGNSIALDGFVPGIYFVKIYTSAGVETTKLMKK